MAALEQTLRQGDYLGLCRPAQCNHKWEKEAERKVEQCHRRRISTVVAVKMECRVMSRGMRAASRSSKRLGNGFSHGGSRKECSPGC